LSLLSVDERRVADNREVLQVSNVTKRYLERMAIADARRLAIHLGVPLISLLEASICLADNLGHRHVECCSDLAQIGDLNISITV
jgi:hypothetical protein